MNFADMVVRTCGLLERGVRRKVKVTGDSRCSSLVAQLLLCGAAIRGTQDDGQMARGM